MRESISESWAIPIISFFILLFVAFLTLIISYSKCFKIKNEVISIIEKYEGINDKSLEIITTYLRVANYKGYSGCDVGEFIDGTVYGMPLNGTDFVRITESNKNNKYSYCIKPEYVSNMTLTNYEVVLFYNFNIPVFGNIAAFEVKGKTIDLGIKNADYLLSL